MQAVNIFSKNSIRISFYGLILLGVVIACTGPDEKKITEKRPNILLLVADDLGYADLGSYGGDIETPNIDGLAAEGIRFSNFHTANMCAPTRAMLLSGNDNHIAGVGAQSLTSNEFGYEGMLTNRIATIPQILKEAGYHTYMAGKWHLGTSPEANPHKKGFEHSFALLLGAANHSNDQGWVEKYPVSPYTEDGKPATWKEGNYSTNFYTDKIIEYIKRHKEDEKPFFAMAAYTSPHWPLQVDEATWKKYEGRYNDGYEKLKERRLESLKEAGMIPLDAVLPPNHEMIEAWDSLSSEEQKRESRKMELYAGMVDNLDFNIGRLIDYLKEIGEYENTMVIFMSDNGAAAEDFYNHEKYSDYIREYFNNRYDNMGQPTSFVSYGPQWAEAGSSPFRYYKGFTTEGGISAPLIIAGSAVKKQNEIHDGFLTLLDIAPTIYELAKTQYPDSMKGNELYPLKGNSLIPFLSGKVTDIHTPDYVFGHEHYNRAMIRKGDWKIVNTKKPFQEENFQLFNLANDRGELNDLKDVEPEKYTELLEEWKKFVSETKVRFPTPEQN